MARYCWGKFLFLRFLAKRDIKIVLIILKLSLKFCRVIFGFLNKEVLVQ